MPSLNSNGVDASAPNDIERKANAHLDTANIASVNASSAVQVIQYARDQLDSALSTMRNNISDSTCASDDVADTSLVASANSRSVLSTTLHQLANTFKALEESLAQPNLTKSNSGVGLVPQVDASNASATNSNTNINTSQVSSDGVDTGNETQRHVSNNTNTQQYAANVNNNIYMNNINDTSATQARAGNVNGINSEIQFEVDDSDNTQHHATNINNTDSGAAQAYVNNSHNNGTQAHVNNNNSMQHNTTNINNRSTTQSRANNNSNTQNNAGNINNNNMNMNSINMDITQPSIQYTSTSNMHITTKDLTNARPNYSNTPPHSAPASPRLKAPASPSIESSTQTDGGGEVFSTVQYNVLADYLGSNFNPWFLYGSGLKGHAGKLARERILERYYENGGANSWPIYVQGELDEEAIERVEAIHNAYFVWSERQERLLSIIHDLDADLLSLVELDHYEDVFRDRLAEWGYDSVFAKRPRLASRDGCGVFWKRDKFSYVAHASLNFIDEYDEETKLKRSDRCCLCVLVKARKSGMKMLFVSVHFARNPENPELDNLRGKQLVQLLQLITSFSKKHGVMHAPVVVAGDMNATSLSKLRGIAGAATILAQQRTHPFLWRFCDVPSGCTSITSIRRMRVDTILYQDTHLQIIDLGNFPVVSMNDPIPNQRFPSDHLPVKAVFRVKRELDRCVDVAREWWSVASGENDSYAGAPLDEHQLRRAFMIYDYNGTDSADEYSLTRGLALTDLFTSHATITNVLSHGTDNKLNFTEFCVVYLQHERFSEDSMRQVFDTVDKDHSGVITKAELVSFFSMFRGTRLELSPEHIEKALTLSDFMETVCHPNSRSSSVSGSAPTSPNKLGGSNGYASTRPSVSFCAKEEDANTDDGRGEDHINHNSSHIHHHHHSNHKSHSHYHHHHHHHHSITKSSGATNGHDDINKALHPSINSLNNHNSNRDEQDEQINDNLARVAASATEGTHSTTLADMHLGLTHASFARLLMVLYARLYFSKEVTQALRVRMQASGGVMRKRTMSISFLPKLARAPSLRALCGDTSVCAAAVAVARTGTVRFSGTLTMPPSANATLTATAPDQATATTAAMTVVDLIDRNCGGNKKSENGNFVATAASSTTAVAVNDVRVVTTSSAASVCGKSIDEQTSRENHAKKPKLTWSL